ncbi:MAG: ATP-binding protein [Marmoricola sp.]|nr:ATP-binding protein [Marmoricola sp.]
MSPSPPPLLARVVVVAGPSGSGKSRLTRRLDLPALNLDDFYKEGSDPTLPSVEIAGGDPIVDWDSPGSWNGADAVAVIEELCRTGSAQVPTYDISRSERTGLHRLDLGSSRLLVAEGIFAQEIVAVCQRRGLLADAICVTQHPAVTFVRRLGRDLREHRKPPFYLVRRGLHLALAQRSVVDHAVALGCRVVHPEEAYRELSALRLRASAQHPSG